VKTRLRTRAGAALTTLLLPISVTILQHSITVFKFLSRNFCGKYSSAAKIPAGGNFLYYFLKCPLHKKANMVE
jgi:hypothetical protein